MNTDQNSNPVIDNTAPRWKRFVAIFIDIIITSTCVDFFINQEKSEALAKEISKYDRAIPPELLQQCFSYLFNYFVIFIVTLLVLNCFLLFKNGQTFGKVIMKLAIRDLENNIPSFFPLLTARYLVQIPMIVIPFLMFVDYLFIILRSDRRSIHDLIAKTKVIDLSIQVAPSTPTFVA